MGWRFFFTSLVSMFFIFLLILYWFVPFENGTFTPNKVTSSNFSLMGDENNQMQFYPNMRFPSNNITTTYEGCTGKKKIDVDQAFEILEEKTILNFNQISLGGEINVNCEGEIKFESGMFIAGEGGPTNITKAGEFNLIQGGIVNILKESDCPKPNIAIHEILHALGFQHSENINNIMYKISKCSQTISDDIIGEINRIYSIPPYPDLIFENVSARTSGRYLDTEVSIRNYGLEKSKTAELIIYSGNKTIKTSEIDPIEVGYGASLIFKNIWIVDKDATEIRYEINYSEPELDKSNNIIILSKD